MRPSPTPDPPADDPYQAILLGIADARVDDAAAARARVHWLAHQAEEGGTLLGALCDLAEQGRAARLTLRGGHAVEGRVATLEGDTVTVLGRDGAPTVVRRAQVLRVRVDGGAAASGPVPTRRTTGEPHSGDTFDAVLRSAATDRRTGVVATDDGAEHRGQLRAVGVDVLTLRVGDGATSTLLIALDTITAVRFSDLA